MGLGATSGKKDLADGAGGIGDVCKPISIGRRFALVSTLCS